MLNAFPIELFHSMRCLSRKRATRISTPELIERRNVRGIFYTIPCFGIARTRRRRFRGRELHWRRRRGNRGRWSLYLRHLILLHWNGLRGSLRCRSLYLGWLLLRRRARGSRRARWLGLDSCRRL